MNTSKILLLFLLMFVSLPFVEQASATTTVDFLNSYQDYNGLWHKETNENLALYPAFLKSEDTTNRIFTTWNDSIYIPKSMDVTVYPFKVSPSKTYPKTVLIANMINVPTIVTLDGVTYPANTLAYLVFPHSLSRVKDYADDHNIRLGRWNFKTDIIIYDDNATVNYLPQSAYNFRIVGDEIRLYFIKTEANKLLGNITFQMNSWTINNATTSGFTSANISFDGVRWTDSGQIAINLRNDSQANMTGLVAYWSMDENTGTAVHQVNTESGLVNTTIQGTWYGNTTLNYSTGQIGNALSFDGVNDYVNAGNDASLDIINAITIEAWLKPNTISGYNIILGNAESGVKGYDAFMFNGFVYYRTNRPEEELTISAVALSVGVWTHLAVTRSGATAKIYLNGTEVTYTAQPAHADTVTSDLNFFIGRYAAADHTHFNGFIDEVRIYNRALSADEIAILYNTSMRTQGNVTILNQSASAGNVINRTRITYTGHDAINNISLDATQNGTSNWFTVQENLTSNTWYNLVNQYQSMDFRVRMNGNGSNTVFFTSLEWDEWTNYIPPTPVIGTVTTGNFWKNITWSAGSGNVTDSYNVSRNGTWYNGTATFLNTTTIAHGWINDTIYAWNSSGAGILSSALTNNTRIPNNIPSIPSLLTPTNSSSTTTTLTNFTWNGSTDSDSDNLTYDLRVNESIVSTGITVNYILYNLSLGSNNWSVRSYDGYNYSAWSSVYDITYSEESTTPSAVIPSYGGGGSGWAIESLNKTSTDPVTILPTQTQEEAILSLSTNNFTFYYKTKSPTTLRVYDMSFRSECETVKLTISNTNDIVSINTSYNIQGSNIRFIIPNTQTPDSVYYKIYDLLWVKKSSVPTDMTSDGKYLAVLVKESDAGQYTFIQSNPLYELQQVVSNPAIIIDILKAIDKNLYDSLSNKSITESIYTVFNPQAIYKDLDVPVTSSMTFSVTSTSPSTSSGGGGSGWEIKSLNKTILDTNKTTNQIISLPRVDMQNLYIQNTKIINFLLFLMFSLIIMLFISTRPLPSVVLSLIIYIIYGIVTGIHVLIETTPIISILITSVVFSLVSTTVVQIMNRI